MNVTIRVPSLTLPLLLALAGCGDDLESRNAALGLEEDGGATELTIERAAPEQPDGGEAAEAEVTSDSIMSEEAAPADGTETVVEAGPDDLIDRAEGFAPEPMDDAAGFNPSPHVHTSGE